jgi:phosphoribosylamine--glycine ligase
VASDAQPAGGALVTARFVMPTRVLVVGGGGREHAIAWKLAAEPGVNDVIVAPGSAGIAGEPRVRIAPDVDPLDAAALVDLARREAVELAVIGPEAPLAAGAADALVAAGVPTFGPSQAAARIESSKAFCRDVAAAAGVRMADGRAFETLAPARAYAHELAARGDGVVVKADGLAAGKGVTVCSNAREADEALDALFSDAADNPAGGVRVVIEERLEGEEASLIALCDGRNAVALPLARDHKRLADGDRGPNTGGMGAYSPLPDLSDEAVPELLASIHRPILAELARRGMPFVGALYAGLMLTRQGPLLLECNARFGDPETQVLLPRLATALGPLLLAAARAGLGGEAASAVAPDGLLPVTRDATVGVVLAAAGYPDAPRRGDAIEGVGAAARDGALVFHAGTVRDEAGDWRTAGGRVLTVVGRGTDLEAARASAERAADAIAWTGLQRRHDIAADAPFAVVGSGR